MVSMLNVLVFGPSLSINGKMLFAHSKMLCETCNKNTTPVSYSIGMCCFRPRRCSFKCPAENLTLRVTKNHSV